MLRKKERVSLFPQKKTSRKRDKKTGHKKMTTMNNPAMKIRREWIKENSINDVFELLNNSSSRSVMNAMFQLQADAENKAKTHNRTYAGIERGKKIK